MAEHLPGMCKALVQSPGLPKGVRWGDTCPNIRLQITRLPNQPLGSHLTTVVNEPLPGAATVALAWAVVVWWEIGFPDSGQTQLETVAL